MRRKCYWCEQTSFGFLQKCQACGIFSNQGTEPTFVEPWVWCLFGQQSGLEKAWLKEEEGLVYS